MSSPSVSRSSAKRPRKGFENKTMLTCHTCRRSRRNGDWGKGMWPFIYHYKGHNGTVVVSQHTAPTYRKTADAMRADNPKTGALSSFCILYKYTVWMSMFVWRMEEAWYSTAAAVLIQYSKSGHIEPSRAAAWVAHNLRPRPSSVSFECYACALRRLLNQCTTLFRTLCNE
jgi:hypothetical protein